MAGRKKNRFIELCFMCQSKRVRYGYCHSCGHLSKYADQYRRYEAPPKGVLWKPPVHNFEKEDDE